MSAQQLIQHEVASKHSIEHGCMDMDVWDGMETTLILACIGVRITL